MSTNKIEKLYVRPALATLPMLRGIASYRVVSRADSSGEAKKAFAPRGEWPSRRGSAS